MSVRSDFYIFLLKASPFRAGRRSDFSSPSFALHAGRKSAFLESLLRVKCHIRSDIAFDSIAEGRAMSYFLQWWGKYKRKLGADFERLPGDFEDFVLYLDRVPLNLQSKQEIVRMLAKSFLGRDFKRSPKNMKRYRRALRYYNEFKEWFLKRHSITFAPVLVVA